MEQNHLNGYFNFERVCNYCSNKYETSQCILVDLERSQDLKELLETNTINRSICPNCYEPNSHPGPILILQRTKKPHLLFTTHSFQAEENENNLKVLWENLVSYSGDEWQEIWKEENVQIVEHRFLPYLYQQFIECPENVTVSPLLLKLFTLLQIDEDDVKQQMIAQFPELISFEVVDALEEMIVFSEERDDDMSYVFNNNKQILELTLWGNGIKRQKKQPKVTYETSQRLNEAFGRLKDAESAQDYEKTIELCLDTFSIAKEESKAYFIARCSAMFIPWLAMVDPKNAKTSLESIITLLEWSAKDLETTSKYSFEYQLVHMNLGSLYVDLINGSREESIEKSISYSFTAIDIPLGNHLIPDIHVAYHNLGRAYTERLKGDKSKNYETSIKFFKGAQSLRDPIRDAYNIAGTNSALGVVYFYRFKGSRKKNLEKSIEFHNKAVDYYRSNGLNDNLADALVNKANSYVLRIEGGITENVRLAIECCEEALIVHSKRYPPEQKAKILTALANAYFDYLDGSVPENLDKSIAYHRQAIDVLKNAIDTRALASYQMNLANAYCRRPSRNTLETAIDLYKLALKNFSLNNHGHEYFEIHLNLAAAYIERIEGDEKHNCEEAIKYYKSAKKMFGREKYPFKWANINYGLARAYSKLSKKDKVANYTDAIKYYEHALKIFTIDDFPRMCRAVQTNVADLHFENNEWESARLSYGKAIEAGEGVLLEALNGTGHRHEIGQNSTLYACLAYCLTRLGRYGEALLTADTGKTRALMESIEIDDISNTFLPDALRKQLASLSSDVKDLEYKRLGLKASDKKDLVKSTTAKLVEKRTKLNALKEDIRTTFSDTFSNNITVSGFIKLIPDDGVILVPVLTKKGTMVFVLPHGCDELSEENVLWIDEFTFDDFKNLLIGNNKLDEYSGWVGNSENYMMSSNFMDRRYNWNKWIQTIDHTCNELWKNLFSHIHRTLEKYKFSEGSPLIIIPQGGLGIVPLHAAFRIVEGKRRYLVEDFTINYIPSGQVLRQCLHRASSKNESSNSMLAIINPTSDLTYASYEWEVIKKYFENDSETVSLVENNATIEKVSNAIEDKAYIHFACHGYYDWFSPEKSGLVMANKESMSLAFIKSNLDLRKNKLTVLSACETGVIDIIKAPDEFVSLPSGLMQVGVPTVLSTLWTVEDKSTQLLMGEFYRNHIEEGKSISESLVASQKWLMSYNTGEGQTPFSHPFYWAAFMIVGI